MHVPAAFRKEESADLLRAIERWNFGLLASERTSHGIRVTPAPFRVEWGEPVRLVTHLARANPQARELSELEGMAVTVFFLGPHAYISPRWLTGAEDSVPTWNYVATEVRGPVRILNEPERIERELRELVAHHEGLEEEAWSPDSLPTDARVRLHAAVTVIEIQIESIEGSWKLSQNKSESARRALAHHLEVQPASSPPQEMAYLVRATLTPSVTRRQGIDQTFPGDEPGALQQWLASWRAGWQRSVAQLRAWRRRQRARRALLQLDGRMRADLGVRWEQVAAEAGKPFWRR